MGTPRVDDETRKTKTIGLRLNPTEKSMVNHICSVNELDISDMIRELIKKEHDRVKEK